MAVSDTPAKVLKRAMGSMRGVELARRTAVTPKHVSQLLNGQARITFTYAIALERALGVPRRAFTNAQMWVDLKKARAHARAKELQ